MKKMPTKNSGFSILELLVALSIVATILVFGYPSFQSWSSKNSFLESQSTLYGVLSEARTESLARNKNILVATVTAVDRYTFRLFYTTNATKICNSSVTWTSIKDYSIELNSNFEIEGSATSNLCFYYDGTSSGGIYYIKQKDDEKDLGYSKFNIFLPTGYIDVSKED